MATAALNHPSPINPLSSSLPNVRQESSTSSAPSHLLPRPPVQSSPDSVVTPFVGHPGREPPYSRSASNSASFEHHQSRLHDSLSGLPRASASTPSLVHQNTSSSSGYSSGSGLSNHSTTGSSLYTSRSNEDESWPQLPPLSAASVKVGATPSLADYSLRNSKTPESITPPSGTQPPLAQPQYSPSSSISSGMSTSCVLAFATSGRLTGCRYSLFLNDHLAN